jgi:hypothetical protein
VIGADVILPGILVVQWGVGVVVDSGITVEVVAPGKTLFPTKWETKLFKS